MLWVTALAAAPTGAVPRISTAAYIAGSLICHQKSERSFHRDGSQYPVCARCLGLYLGAMGGVLIWVAIAGVSASPRRGVTRFTSPPFVRRTLVIAALPTLASVALAWLGWWDAENMIRAVFALPLGVVVAAIATAVAAGDLR